MASSHIAEVETVTFLAVASFVCQDLGRVLSAWRSTSCVGSGAPSRHARPRLDTSGLGRGPSSSLLACASPMTGHPRRPKRRTESAARGFATDGWCVLGQAASAATAEAFGDFMGDGGCGFYWRRRA